MTSGRVSRLRLHPVDAGLASGLLKCGRLCGRANPIKAQTNATDNSARANGRPLRAAGDRRRRAPHLFRGSGTRHPAGLPPHRRRRQSSVPPPAGRCRGDEPLPRAGLRPAVARQVDAARRLGARRVPADDAVVHGGDPRLLPGAGTRQAGAVEPPRLPRFRARRAIRGGSFRPARRGTRRRCCWRWRRESKRPCRHSLP